MFRSTLENLRHHLGQSAEFRGRPGNNQWLRSAIALAAVGYTTVVIHRLLFLPVSPWEHYKEITAAALSALSCAAFTRSPRGASLLTLSVIWCEPVVSIGTAGELAATSLLVLPVVVATSGLIFGRRSAVITAALSMIAVPSALLLHLLWTGAPLALSPVDTSTLIVTEFVLAGLGLLTWGMVRSLDRAMAASERLQRQYADLFEHSPNGLLSLDQASVVVEINERAARMLGLDRAGLRGRAFAAVLTDAGVTSFVDLERASPDSPIEITLDRTGAPLRHLALLHRIETGHETRRMIALADVTERRRTEERLRQSEERFRSLIESVPNIAVQGYDRNRRVIFWNSASAHLYGFTRDEALGQALEDLIIPRPMREGVIAAVDAWVRGGDPIPAGELTLQRKDGSPLRVFSSHVMQVNARSEPEMYCIDVDLTERERAAAVRRETEARFQLLFNSSNDAVMVYTLKADGTPDRFIEVNDVACTRLEYTREEFLELSPLALEAPARDDADATGRPRPAGRTLAETEHVSKTGRRFAVEISSHSFQLGGRPTVLAVARDISTRRTLEQQLRQAQKMEVVGRLAGGVAHDFNNILTAMLLNLEVMRDAEPGTETSSNLHELESMAKRAAKLTQQLLMFARRQTLKTSRVELNAALASVLKLLHRLLGEHITLNLETDASPLWLDADPSLLDQVVMNLCLNARDAMPDGGRLTLATSRVEFGAVPPPGQPEARPGTFACLRITDTGCGMSREIVQHLFEPFFTTKEVGQGTGLGLASVHGIVHQHQGWLEVESAVGQGSTFRIFLPAADPRTDPNSVSPFGEPKPRGHETILLVEDEEIVRKVTRSMLEMLGYRVLSAANGVEATRIWQEKAAVIDLLFTDMVMPGGVNGMRLGERFRAVKPTLKILLMSGYSREITRGESQRALGVGFLAKPFESRALAATVRKCLDDN